MSVFKSRHRWMNYKAFAGVLVMAYVGCLSAVAFAYDQEVLVNQLAQAAQNGNTENIAEIREKITQNWNESQGAEKAQAQYYLAYADFRLASIDRSKGVDLLSRCLKLTSDMNKEAWGLAEVGALRAACAGNLISIQPERAMELSQIGEEAITVARAADPENPRVAMIDGVNTLFKPASYGGGPDNALKLFEESVRYFEKPDGGAKDGGPTWGHDEAYTWVGVVYSMSGRNEEALVALESAAEINPNNYWVTEHLIPTVQSGGSLKQFYGSPQQDYNSAAEDQ